MRGCGWCSRRTVEERNRTKREMQGDKSPMHLSSLIAYLLFISSLFCAKVQRHLRHSRAVSSGSGASRRGEGSQAERSKKSEREERNVREGFYYNNIICKSHRFKNKKRNTSHLPGFTPTCTITFIHLAESKRAFPFLPFPFLFLEKPGIIFID